MKFNQAIKMVVDFTDKYGKSPSRIVFNQLDYNSINEELDILHYPTDGRFQKFMNIPFEVSSTLETRCYE